MNKLVLIDGNSLSFRAFMHYLCYQTKQAFIPMQIWFCNVTREDFKRRKAKSFLVAFDAGKTTFRHENIVNIKVDARKRRLN